MLIETKFTKAQNVGGQKKERHRRLTLIEVVDRRFALISAY